MLSSGRFMMLPLAEGPLAVHQADSMAQAHSMEHDQFLPAQTIDCEKHLAPREVRLPAVRISSIVIISYR